MASVYQEKEATFLFDKSELGFSDAVAISGIDARQLRNALDRGTIKVGKKLRVGRWVFTLRDCFQLLIIAQLGARTWMPVSQAAEVAQQIAPMAESLLDEIYSMHSRLKEITDPAKPASDSQFIVFQGRHSVRVLIHRRGEAWGFYEMDGTRTELKNWLEPHIRMPALGLVSALMTNFTATLGEELPPGVAESIRREAIIEGDTPPEVD